MASGSENSKDGKSGADKAESRARSKAIILASAAIFAFVAIGVYLVAHRPSAEGSKELQLPRLSFDPAAVKADMDNLRSRTRGFEPRPKEMDLVKALGDLHRREVSGDDVAAKAPDAGAPPTSVELMARFRKLARPYYRENSNRYLRLGEHLALDFDDALNDVLSMAKKQGLQKTLEEGGPEVERLIRAGGGFLTMAVERGLISDEGELRAPPVLPQVLFRRKWCAMAGFERQAGLSKAETQANLDFIIAFSPPGSGRRRLKAVDELASLRPDYRADLAEAMVLEDNGQADEALRIYREISAKRPEDEAVAAAVSRLEAARDTKEGQ